MKLHNCKTAFFLILLEVYGVFSAAIEPQSESISDLQKILHCLTSFLNSFKDSLTHVNSLGKIEDSPYRSFPFRPNPLLHLSCRPPWVLVGKTCLFTDLSKSTSWQEGRNFCKELHKGSDLVVFKDANEFAETLRHVRTINSLNKAIHFWVGGSDLDRSEEWLWITGEPMPKGAPFWGVDGSGKPEPHANNEHCAFLYFPNRYYLHDVPCKGWSGKVVPLCQYNPFSY